jgi:hypothetical protein
MVPSGTIESKFWEPLIKGKDNLVGWFDELLLIHPNAQLISEKNRYLHADPFSSFHHTDPDEPTTRGRQRSPPPPPSAAGDGSNRIFQSPPPPPPPSPRRRGAARRPPSLTGLAAKGRRLADTGAPTSPSPGPCGGRSRTNTNTAHLSLTRSAARGATRQPPSLTRPAARRRSMPTVRFHLFISLPSITSLVYRSAS